MSVRYCTRMGYGFIVDCEIVKEFHESCPEFFDSEFAYPVDCWANYPHYFFGLIIKTVSPGAFYQIPVSYDYDRTKFKEMLVEYRKFFPEEESYMPHLFALSCVD